MNASDEFHRLPERQRHVLRESLAGILGIQVDDVPSEIDSKWLSQTSIDSLDFVELVMEIEEEFGDDDEMMPPIAMA